MKATFEELRSDKALVCRREVTGESGGATVWLVLLSDGFLIECGTSFLSEQRARTLAEIINEAGPERLSEEALQAERVAR